MYRTTTSLLTALIAVVFAIGALVSMRWPSLIMAGSLISSDEIAKNLHDINWRQLGVTYGAPYFLAAICFHFSALATSNRRHGSFTWFLFGCAAGFPVAFFVDFEPGWLQDPSLGELSLMNAAALSILLAWAIWDLRQREYSAVEGVSHALKAEPQASAAQDSVDEDLSPQTVLRPRRYRPVPAAIARQRRLFAEQGRRQLARQRRS